MINDLMLGYQNDGYSCGMHVILNAMIINRFGLEALKKNSLHYDFKKMYEDKPLSECLLQKPQHINSVYEAVERLFF